MINKEIIINKKTREIINGENGDLFRLGVDGENLQENIVFKFEDEFVNGTARVEITMQDDTKSYVMTTKQDESYILPIKSVIAKHGLNTMQLVITQGTSEEEIPIFKSKTFSFYIDESVNADSEAPEEYESWLEQANTKLNELDNVDIEAEKENHTATITITKKDGTEEVINIYDGEKGDTGERGPQGERGETGPAGPQGERGLTGERGPQGEIGPKGDTGSTGATGETGPAGPQGPKGDTGETGPAGRDGYVQYTAGDNITIENNVISAISSADFTINIDEHLTSTTALNISELKPGRYTLKSNNDNRYFYVKADTNYQGAIITLSEFSLYEPFVVVNSPFEDSKLAFYYVANDNRTMTKYRYKNGTSSGFSTTVINDNYPILRTYRTDSNSVASTNTFTGTNTFTKLPQSSVVPTNDNELTNKKYVDDLISSAGGGTNVKNFTTTPAGALILSENEDVGFYVNQNISSYRLNYVKTADSQVYSTSYNIIFYEITKDLSEATTNETVGYAIGIWLDGTIENHVGKITQIGILKDTDGHIRFSNSDQKYLWLLTNGTQRFVGLKKYDTLPQIITYTTPTNDNEFVPKKYVDDKIGDINTILASLTTPGGNS